MSYQQHFGERSADYLHYRPGYPDELFSYLASLTKAHELAWDCGTGNGQSAVKLADYFIEVVATDINAEQMNVAPQKPNVCYQLCPVEHTNLLDQSVDLITVAQALHWFDFDKFYREVERVSKPQGMLAAWSYSLGKIFPAVDSLVADLYYQVLGDEYWPPERKYIDDYYKTIPFPFEKMPTPCFEIRKSLTFEQLAGYLQTWSAVKEYEKRNKSNPVTAIYESLKTAWGNAKEHTMIWPIHLLVGKVHHAQ